ncbi:hypothetical protein K450DRAFT_218586 [Umbelopsis ramanniana AG]|uniref:DNA polymerase n=1 Tax=Umbelopsis ramanniana AG TaxID=1314678 RepID=A0AAD5HIZ4_UMBRA|nr:uncharacterized protein K450DRAFT_218586 [Umbelopsis ramanniana AG]KAI8584191.1 hypothetical protein K450DRAFT_218586 [Umbelopsis ramanniana AG]
MKSFFVCRVNDVLFVNPKVEKAHFWSCAASLLRDLTMAIFTGMRIFIVETKLGPFSVSTVKNMIKAHGGEISPDQANANMILTGMKAPARLARHIQTTQAPIIDVKWINDCVKEETKLSTKNYAIHLDIEQKPPRLSSPEPADDIEKSTPFEQDSTSDSSDEEIDIDPKFHNSFHECLRPTPFEPKYNKELIRLLELLEMKRHTNGESMSSLSYRHAIAALKAYPREIRSSREAQQIKEAKAIESDVKFHVMSKFLKVWGVGQNLAQEWWNSGYRSLDEVYQNASLPPTIKLGIELFDQLNQRLSRKDCEEILGIIEKEAKDLLPGCEIYPVGGYRRGKESNGDVDLVLSHPDELKNQNFLKNLVDRLCSKGYIVHKLRYSEPSANRFEEKSLVDANKDLIDSCYTAFLQPSTGILRQVDILVAPPSQLYTTILGWTGSRQFERSLRSYAETKGLHVASFGIFTDRSHSHRIPVTDEKEAFEVIGIPWLEPELRNC